MVATNVEPTHTFFYPKKKKNLDKLASVFKTNESKKYIYSKYLSGKGVIICLYVDDMLIFETDLE